MSPDDLDARPLIVWHPSVHKLYGEDLHYFLIRARFFGATFADHVKRALDTAGVRGYCAYEVFGDYDILVRAWVTRTKREAFRSAMSESPQVAAMAEFEAHTVRYVWSEKQNLVRDAAVRTAVVRCGGRSRLREFQENPEDDGHLRGELLKEGVLLDYRHISAADSAKVKFYCFFDIAISHQVEKIADGLATHVRKQHIDMPSLCVGTGAGCGPILLKGVADTIYDISNAIVSILETFPYTGLVSKTYVVARRGWSDSDDVDFSFTGDFELALRYADMLQIEISVLDGLKPTIKRRFERKFEALQNDPELAVFRDESLFRALFGALAYQHTRTLKHELYFVVEMEAALREFTKHFMSEVYDDTRWPARVLPQLAGRVGLDATKGFDRYTMAEVISVLGAVDTEKDSRVTEALGPKWQTTLRTLTSEVRNKWAHATLDDDEWLEEPQWEELVDLLVDSLKIHARLQHYITGRRRRERA